jgi:hypothetical protein
VSDYGQKATFEPREIIHVSLDSAHPGVVGVSPMQAALGPVTAWLFAAATGKELSKKGLPPTIHADFPAAAQDKDMRTWRDQYATKNVGVRNIGAPIVTKPGDNLLHLGQVVEIEHEQVVAAGRRTRAAVIMLGELQVVLRAGQPEQHAPVTGVTGEAVKLG